MTCHCFRKLLIGLSLVVCHLSFGVAIAGCTSSEDDDQQTDSNTINDVKKLEAGFDQRPSWQMPNFDDYEMTMSVEVRLQPTLQAYASAQDLLCATIGNEVRGVALPKQVGDVWVLPLTLGSNAGNVEVALSYYCDSLHRIFTTVWTYFDPSVAPLGTGGIYEPKFVE